MMKKFCFILLLVIPTFLLAQNNEFTLEGTLGNLNAPARVFLNASLRPSGPDSVDLKDGHFVFKGRIAEPLAVVLYLNTKGSGYKSKDTKRVTLWIYPGQIKMVSPGDLDNVLFQDSEMNTDFQKMVKYYRSISAQLAVYKSEIQRADPSLLTQPLKRQSLDNRLNQICRFRDSVLINFVSTHKNSVLGASQIYSFRNLGTDSKRVDSLYNLLSDEVKHSREGRLVAAHLGNPITPGSASTPSNGASPATNQAAGQSISVKPSGFGYPMAKDFTQRDMNGKKMKLSDLRGKYVLLDFWASWCGPCRRENPNVVAAYNKYHSKGLEILGVSLDKDLGEWLRAIRNDNLTWYQVSDLYGWENEVAVLYDVKSIPQNFLIDPEGRIIDHNLRGRLLEMKLGEIFK